MQKLFFLLFCRACQKKIRPAADPNLACFSPPPNKSQASGAARLLHRTNAASDCQRNFANKKAAEQKNSFSLLS